jgi:tetratricopeptide (TPR) repeat protein
MNLKRQFAPIAISCMSLAVGWSPFRVISSPALAVDGKRLPICGTAHLAMAAENFRTLWRKANLDAARGDYKEAEAWYKGALKSFLAGPALQLHPLKDEVALAYAQLLRAEGLASQAEPLEQEARPTILRRQAELEQVLARAKEKSAAPNATEDDKYSTFLYRHLLANMDRALGKFDQAESLYKEALSQAPTVEGHYDIASLKQDYAVVLYWTGRADEAKKLLSDSGKN